MRSTRSLCVVYDGECGLCAGVRDWINRQAGLVPVEFVAAGSPEAGRRFGKLPAGELVVIGDTGEIWLGNHAWIVCLWALRDYRDWAVRFSNPLLLMMAREAFAIVSSNRAGLSRTLGLRSDAELERQLRKVMVPGCEIKTL